MRYKDREIPDIQKFFSSAIIMLYQHIIQKDFYRIWRFDENVEFTIILFKLFCKFFYFNY